MTNADSPLCIKIRGGIIFRQGWPFIFHPTFFASFQSTFDLLSTELNSQGFKM